MAAVSTRQSLHHYFNTAANLKNGFVDSVVMQTNVRESTEIEIPMCVVTCDFMPSEIDSCGKSS